MADIELSLVRGSGGFFLDGNELSYDSTPAEVTGEGGIIDFRLRGVEEQSMLQGNRSAKNFAQELRTQAVMYGGYLV